MLDMLMLLIGISGVISIALNFIFEITNKYPKDHHAFALLNLYGSLALFIYALYGKVWLFVILNSFLILVGIYGLYNVFSKHKKN